MLVPLPQAFAVDRGSMREGPDVATLTPHSDGPSRSGLMAPSSAAGSAGTSSSGASSEISPTRTDTTAEASDYDDCSDDSGDVADLNAAPASSTVTAIFSKHHLATDEGDRACVLDCSNDDLSRRQGRVHPPCLWPAP